MVSQQIEIINNRVIYCGNHIGYLEDGLTKLFWSSHMTQESYKGFYHIVENYNLYEKEHILCFHFTRTYNETIISYLTGFIYAVGKSSVKDIPQKILYELCINTINSVSNLHESLNIIGDNQGIQWFKTLHKYMNRVKIIEEI